MMSKRRIDWAIYAAFIVLIMLVPLIMDSFWLNRLAKYLVFGMLGIAVALSWGYAGILNLGQGLFFGAGAYMLAMSLKLASSTSLQQGSDKPVPDFMLWNAEPGAKTELCCINKASFLWLPFQSQWFGVAMGLILPVAIAFVLGSIVFRKRIAGVFVSIITLALVLLVRLVMIDAQPVTNGFNGLTDLGWFKLGGFEFDPYVVPTYYLIAVSLSVVLIAARLLVETRAGVILQAIRDDQNRARYLGFDVPAYQTFFFAVSALIAGFAGMLYVIVSEFASPTFMDLSFSITMVVWAAVGGRASILGACIGAILINMISATVSETEGFAEAWKAIIGLIFVLVVLYMPRGIAGLAHDLIDRFITRRPSTPAPAVRVNDPSSQPAEQPMAQAALTIDGLSVDFEGFKAVNGVSMIVEDGELRVLLGANGAGKTTLMDLISGKTKSTGGRVFVHDTEITNWEEHKIARAGIGRKFQIPSVFKELTVRRNLEVASCKNPGVFANLGFGFSAKAKIDEVLELIGLTEEAGQVAAYLSHGQTQWLELGLLITQDPKIILLDEPTAGMTQAETHKTSLIVNNLKGRHTIIVVEHDMAFVREIAERITVLHLGQVLAEGSVAEIENDPKVRAAYLGSKGIT